MITIDTFKPEHIEYPAIMDARAVTYAQTFRGSVYGQQSLVIEKFQKEAMRAVASTVNSQEVLANLLEKVGINRVRP
jgi:hypothetical protein